MKKLTAIIMVLVVVFSTSALNAFAENTTASVEFESGTVIIDPIDPLNPPPAEYASIGSKDIVFQKTQITGSNQSIPAANNDPVGLLITDATGRTTTRWDITVKVSDFVSTTSSDKLDGSMIKLTPIANSTIGPNGKNELSADAPTRSTVSLAATDTPKSIFKSNTTNGSMGRWGSNWSAQLDVLAGTPREMIFESTMTWTLTITP